MYEEPYRNCSYGLDKWRLHRNTPVEQPLAISLHKLEHAFDSVDLSLIGMQVP